MILAIIGPTAVGKTKLSIELAKKYNAIIINCDAMQVYQGLDIGTAKVTSEEKEGITHELLDFVPVTQNYTVYDYQKDARKLLEKYQGRNIIFVGGTGLYLKSTLYDYRFYEETTTNSYDNLTNGERYNLALAKEKNMTIHPNNRKRLVRFLNKEIQEYVEPKPLYNFKIIGLTTSRDILYDKINKRVDVMFQSGLLTEVKSFYDQGIRSKALETGIGYKELYQYFDNKITLEEAKDLIKKNSRHYAKRQYTFFNHQLDVKWFDTNYEDFSKTIKEVEDYIENC